MARIRSIKPEFRTSLTVTSWPRDVRLFFALLWGYLDDYGRGVDEPRLIKADCFPLDDDITAATIDEWLDLMAKTDTVRRYEVKGRRYVCVPEWSEHQKPQHPKASPIPPAELMSISGDLSRHEERLGEVLMRDSGETHESLTPEGEGRVEVVVEEKEKPSSSEAADAAPDQESENAPDDGPGDDSATSPAKPDKNARDDVRSLCDLLADLMVGNGCKRPTITVKWLDNARLMIDTDGRDPVKAANLIRWCQADQFWRSNIQSMPTFRAQYDQLRLKAIASIAPNQGRGSGSGSTTTDRVMQAQSLKRGPAAQPSHLLAIGGGA